MKKVMFIASGGGHLEELLQLSPLFEKYDYSLISEKTFTTKFLKDKYKNVSYLVYGTKEHLFSYIFIFSFNIIKSLFLLIKYNPEVIITTGTHTAVPMIIFGHLFKKKCIWIETLANADYPTSAGKMVGKYCDLVIVQWESMKKHYKDSVYWGNLF